MLSFLRLAKIISAVGFVLTLAVGLLAYMSYSKYQSILTEIVRSRIGVIAFDARGTIEAGLELGLPLKALQNARATIERASTRDPGIVAIRVINRQGNVFYVSPATAADFSPASAASLFKAMSKSTTKESLVSVTTDSLLRIGTPLNNSFDQTVGYLVIDYDRAAISQRMQAFLVPFMRNAAITIGGALSVMAVLLSVLLMMLERDLDRLGRVMTVPPQPDVLEDDPPVPIVADISEELQAFRDSQSRAYAGLAEAERLVENA